MCTDGGDIRAVCAALKVDDDLLLRAGGSAGNVDVWGT
jgi:hypothetical protein